MPDRQIKVGTVADFVREVAVLRQLWKRDSIDELWFRGESAKHFQTTLRPSLYRSDRETADILDLEERLFEEFRRSGRTLTEVQPEDDANWYFLMQHHGCPTRLLDWSDGALIALHFALTSASSYKSTDDCVVYALDPNWLDDELPEVIIPAEVEDEWTEFDLFLPRVDGFAELPLPHQPLVLEFQRFTQRIAAQRSRFLIFGLDRDPLTPLLSTADSRLVKIIFDGSRKVEARYDLRTSGVTEAVVYPDLDGLGREISNLWKDFEPTHKAPMRSAITCEAEEGFLTRLAKTWKGLGRGVSKSK